MRSFLFYLLYSMLLYGCVDGERTDAVKGTEAVKTGGTTAGQNTGKDHPTGAKTIKTTMSTTVVPVKSTIPSIVKTTTSESTTILRASSPEADSTTMKTSKNPTPTGGDTTIGKPIVSTTTLPTTVEATTGIASTTESSSTSTTTAFTATTSKTTNTIQRIKIKQNPPKMGIDKKTTSRVEQDGHDDARAEEGRRNRSRTSQPPGQNEDEEPNLLWLWISLGIMGFLVVAVPITLVVVRAIIKKKRDKKREDLEMGKAPSTYRSATSGKSPGAPSTPSYAPARSAQTRPRSVTPTNNVHRPANRIAIREMPAGKIDKEHFTFTGPLTVFAIGAKGKDGKVHHDLENVKSHSIKEVIFDDSLNKVADIGSDIEIVQASNENLTTGASVSTLAEAQSKDNMKGTEKSKKEKKKEESRKSKKKDKEASKDGRTKSKETTKSAKEKTQTDTK